MLHLTDERPKCLVPVKGKPLLDWQLKALREAGVQEVALVTGYKSETLSNLGLTTFYNERWAETNMVSSLERAREWLAHDQCIVSYSDIFYSASAVTALVSTEADIAISYDPKWERLWVKRFGDPLADAESFRLGADGNVRDIGNKPQTVEEVQGQYMGLLRFTPKGWAEVERLRAALPAAERDRMHMTGTLQRVIEAQRIPVVAIAYYDEWGEVDSEADLFTYQ